MTRTAIVGLLPLLLVGCDPEEGIRQGLVDPNDPDEISQVLIVPGDRDQGDPPPTSPDPDTPAVGNAISNLDIAPGDSFMLSFDFSSMGAGTGYGGCYVQVAGAADFFDIPSPDPDMSPEAELFIPIAIPTNVGNGQFALEYCVYDNTGLVSNVLTTTIGVARGGEGCGEGCPAGTECVNDVCVGAGALRFTLEWSVDTDVDLHVLTPNGNEISFSNPMADSGTLDVDDTGGGTLVENVFFTAPPPGQYEYWAHNFSGSVSVNWTLSVVTPQGVQDTNSGTLPAERIDTQHFIFNFGGGDF